MLVVGHLIGSFLVFMLWALAWVVLTTGIPAVVAIVSLAVVLVYIYYRVRAAICDKVRPTVGEF